MLQRRGLVNYKFNISSSQKFLLHSHHFWVRFSAIKIAFICFYILFLFIFLRTMLIWYVRGMCDDVRCLTLSLMMRNCFCVSHFQHCWSSPSSHGQKFLCCCFFCAPNETKPLFFLLCALPHLFNFISHQPVSETIYVPRSIFYHPRVKLQFILMKASERVIIRVESLQRDAVKKVETQIHRKEITLKVFQGGFS